MRVRQEAYVEHIIRIDWNAVFEAKGFEHHGQLALAFTQQAGTQHFCQLMHGHFRGIDDQICTGTQRFQQIALFVDGTFKRQILAGKGV
ncbi:hypothetical protein D3C71_1935470 [compost metagenome]